jgi:hypothetical protein
MKKNRRKYSKGELNRLIDSLLHPLFDHSPELMVLDSVLHSIVEQNLTETTQKFIPYNLPKIVDEIIENKSNRSAC